MADDVHGSITVDSDSRGAESDIKGLGGIFGGLFSSKAGGVAVGTLLGNAIGGALGSIGNAALGAVGGLFNIVKSTAARAINSSHSPDKPGSVPKSQPNLDLTA